MKASELREMESAALLEQIEAKRAELFNLKLQWVSNTLEDPNQMRVVRKDIARMLTLLRERELAAELVGGEEANA
jgi:large subunit ribosomal protein L29